MNERQWTKVKVLQSVDPVYIMSSKIAQDLLFLLISGVNTTLMYIGMMVMMIKLCSLNTTVSLCL